MQYSTVRASLVFIVCWRSLVDEHFASTMAAQTIHKILYLYVEYEEAMWQHKQKVAEHCLVLCCIARTAPGSDFQTVTGSLIGCTDEIQVEIPGTRLKGRFVTIRSPVKCERWGLSEPSLPYPRTAVASCAAGSACRAQAAPQQR